MIYSKSFLSYYPYRLITSWLFYCVESRSRYVLKFFKLKYSFVRKICSVKVVALKICNLLCYTHFFVKSIFHFKNRGKPILWVQNQKSEETYKGNNSKSFWSISKLFTDPYSTHRELSFDLWTSSIRWKYQRGHMSWIWPNLWKFWFFTILGAGEDIMGTFWNFAWWN